MDLNVKGDTIIVTASSQGLGKASALRLAKEGAKVTICARSEERLQAAKEEIEAASGQAVLAVPCDITKPADIERVINTTREQHGPVSALVTSAGGPPPGQFIDLPDSDWYDSFDLLVMSAVRFTRALLPDLLAAKGGGRIVYITSITVKQPVMELVLSNSVRMSLLGLAKTLSLQYADEGLRVNCVLPGLTSTQRMIDLATNLAETEGISFEEAQQQQASSVPMQRLGEPDEFADLVAFLASRRAGFLSGQAVAIDGGAIRTSL